MVSTLKCILLLLVEQLYKNLLEITEQINEILTTKKQDNIMRAEIQ